MKTRIEFETDSQALEYREKNGGTAIVTENGNVFWYSLDYYLDDIYVDQPEDFTVLPL